MDSESVIVRNCDDEALCVHACLVTLCKNPSQSVLQGPEAAAAELSPPSSPLLLSLHCLMTAHT